MNTIRKGMEEALVSAGFVPSDILLDLSDTLEAWEKCKVHYGDKLQLIPKIAHEIVLETLYMEANSKKFSVIIRKFLANFKELPIESFVNKLELRLPTVPYPPELSNFSKSEVRFTIAAIVTEILISNEIIHVRVDSVGVKKRSILELGGVDQPVDLFTGLCRKPGEMLQKHNGYERLSHSHRSILKNISDWPWVVSECCTPQLLQRGYELSAEYNSLSRNESPTKRHDRHDRYASAIKEIAESGQFYLPMFYSGSGRLTYYFSKINGLRPGGKLWETLNIDMAQGVLLDVAAINHIKHIIYNTLYGKFSMKYALNCISEADILQAGVIDPLGVVVPAVPYEGHEELYRAAEKEFGERCLLNKCFKALEMAAKGIPCPYLFGKDLTNSGLMIMANSFHSEKMSRLCNFWGLQTVADSHMEFGEANGLSHLSRAQVKDIHTPLLHGSSFLSIAEDIGLQTDLEVSPESVEDNCVNVYGPEVLNISTAVEFGRTCVSNTCNILKWKMPDDFVAVHRAVMKRVPFLVYAATNRDGGRKACHKYSVITTMPLALDSEGFPVFNMDNVTRISKGVRVCTQGLFANITHSIEAFCLRKVIVLLIRNGQQGLFKHDDYMLSPGFFDSVIVECQKFFEFVRDHNMYQGALDQIADKRGVSAPLLFISNAANKIKKSFNFLMP